MHKFSTSLQSFLKINTVVVVDKHYTVGDSVVLVADLVRSSVVVTAPPEQLLAVDWRSASAASVAVAVTSVASSAEVSVGVGELGFSASYCSHPGALMGLGPSDCKSP